ncbi:MAG: hypothetical protein QXS37_05385 [Candidatus Aenigmatarchaeota archaeon]
MIRQTKKGSFDVIIMVMLFFAIIAGIVITIHIANLMKEKMAPSLDETSKEALNKGVDTISNMSDFVGLSLFFLIAIGIIITSFLFFSHPVFIVLYFFIMLAGLAVSVVIPNTSETMLMNTTLNTTTTNYFPKTYYILSHMPYFMLFLFILSGIIIYSKARSEGLI